MSTAGPIRPGTAAHPPRLCTPTARLGWVVAIPAVLLAGGLAGTNMREPSSYDTVVMQVQPGKHVVCVPEHPGAEVGVCGVIVTKHPDLGRPTGSLPSDREYAKSARPRSSRHSDTA